jgi:hypothetical protein
MDRAGEKGSSDQGTGSGCRSGGLEETTSAHPTRGIRRGHGVPFLVSDRNDQGECETIDDGEGTVSYSTLGVVRSFCTGSDLSHLA